MLDAGLLEEQCREGECIVGGNREGEVLLLRKEDGGEVEGREVVGWVGVGIGIVKGLVGRVEEAVRRDEEGRDGGRGAVLRSENDRVGGG